MSADFLLSTCAFHFQQKPALRGPSEERCICPMELREYMDYVDFQEQPLNRCAVKLWIQHDVKHIICCMHLFSSLLEGSPSYWKYICKSWKHEFSAADSLCFALFHDEHSQQPDKNSLRFNFFLFFILSGVYRIVWMGAAQPWQHHTVWEHVHQNLLAPM